MRKILGRLAALTPALVLGLVLVGLAAMTAARFVSTGIRIPILLASFSSYAVLGFLVVLVCCAVAVRGATRRSWVVVTAILAALGLVVQLWSLVPVFTGGGAGKPDLTVMTSNLEFGRGDAVTVVRTVAAQQVDVLVLEEVTPTALSALGTAGIAELLPHRLGVPVETAAGTMVFSRYPLESPRPFELGNVGLDVRVAAPQPFRLLAVHTAQPVGWPKPWFTDMERVRRRTDSVIGNGPTLVVGDFNATRDHRPFREILGTGLRDAAEEAGSGWQPTWPTRYRAGWLRPMITIDHVLTTKHYEALRTRTVEVPHTDHLALVAQLHLSKSRLSPREVRGQ